jgi:hypothetical protein
VIVSTFRPSTRLDGASRAEGDGDNKANTPGLWTIAVQSHQSVVQSHHAAIFFCGSSSAQRVHVDEVEQPRDQRIVVRRF